MKLSQAKKGAFVTIDGTYLKFESEDEDTSKDEDVDSDEGEDVDEDDEDEDAETTEDDDEDEPDKFFEGIEGTDEPWVMELFNMVIDRTSIRL